MKKLVFTFVAALLCIGVFAQQLPSVKLQDLSGKQINSSSLIDGKTPFVISMWMTTCKPSLKELDTISEGYPDWDGPQPLRIYAVSVDDSRSLSRAVALAQGRDWEGIVPLFDVNSDFKRALNVSSVPQVFLYDKNGKLIYTHIGYRPGDEEVLLDKVRKSMSK